MTDDVAQKLVHYRDAAKAGVEIESEIQQVGAVGRFNTGWIESDYLYEEPVLLLDLLSEIGIMQVEIQISEADLDDVLSGVQDVRNLLGSSVYVVPNEDFSKACISTEDDIQFDEEKSHSVYLGESNLCNLQNLEIKTEQSRPGRQKMPIDRMNRILHTERIRRSDENGWMKVKIEMKENNESVLFVVEDLDITWSFDNTADGFKSINTFVEELTIEHLLEGKSEEVWIKPLRDIHYTNRPGNDDLISDMENWVVASEPKDPEKETKGLFTRIKNLFVWDMSNDGGISTGKITARKAKIADTYVEYGGSCCTSLEAVSEKETNTGTL